MTVHPNQIQDWKRRLVEGAEDVFGGNAPEAHHNDKEVEKLHAKIGQLAMENDLKTRRCALLAVARSSAYYRGAPASARDWVLMRAIDEIHLRWPFYGSRRLRDEVQGKVAGSTASVCSGCDTPRANAAASLGIPSEMCFQNVCWVSR